MPLKYYYRGLITDDGVRFSGSSCSGLSSIVDSPAVSSQLCVKAQEVLFSQHNDSHVEFTCRYGRAEKLRQKACFGPKKVTFVRVSS